MNYNFLVEVSKTSFNLSLLASSEKSAWFSSKISCTIVPYVSIFSAQIWVFFFFLLNLATGLIVHSTSMDIFFQSAILSTISCEIWRIPAGITHRPAGEKDSLEARHYPNQPALNLPGSKPKIVWFLRLFFVYCILSKPNQPNINLN